MNAFVNKEEYLEDTIVGVWTLACLNISGAFLLDIIISGADNGGLPVHSKIYLQFTPPQDNVSSSGCRNLEFSRLVSVNLGGSAEMSLNVRPLSAELAAKAQKELNEVPSRLADDVQALKDWIAKQPHLRARTDDQFLVGFLRGSKHSLERAKEKLDLYYTIRTSLGGIYTEDPTSPRNLELLRMGAMLPLPNTITPDGPRILLIRYHNDPSSYNMMEQIRIQNFIGSILMLEDDNMIVGGQIGLIDFKGASMGHFTQFTPSLMKKFAVMTQDANPVRMKSFNYLNVPSFFESIFNFFKTFLNDKMKKRVSGDDVHLT